MTTFLDGRKTTCMLVLWTGYMATWMALSASRPAIAAVWWLTGVVLWQLITRNAARLPVRSNVLETARELADTRVASRQRDAVQDWESEGGAIVEPPRVPTAQAA